MSDSTSDTRSKQQTHVTFRVFNGVIKSWDALSDEASRFASGLAPENLISISHSKNANRKTVIVWYRTSHAEYVRDRNR